MTDVGSNGAPGRDDDSPTPPRPPLDGGADAQAGADHPRSETRRSRAKRRRAEMLADRQRRSETGRVALAIIVGGGSERRASEQLGIPKSTIRRLVEEAMAEVSVERDRFVEKQLVRCEQLIQAHWTDALGHDDRVVRARATREIVRIMHMENQLNGGYPAVPIDVTSGGRPLGAIPTPEELLHSLAVIRARQEAALGLLAPPGAIEAESAVVVDAPPNGSAPADAV